MPNRMLRDWTGSDKINTLNAQAERFFVRLIMKVDDYGCFYADTRLLKANLFPLLLDGVRDADISRWMAECQKAGLIVVYEANSKRYLQIQDFRQRLDKAKSKFPLPSKDNDFPELVNDFPAEVEVEKEVEENTEPEKKRRVAPAKPAPPKKPGKKSEEETEPYWQQLVETWFVFNDQNFKVRPSFDLQEPRHFKNLIGRLRKRAASKSLEWTQENAVSSLNFFLSASYTDDWLQKHFSLKNLLEQFDSIFKRLNQQGKPKTDNVPAAVITDQEIQYLLGCYQEGRLEKKLVTEDHFLFLEKQDGLTLTDREWTEARSIRINSLSGSNQAAELRLLNAYQFNKDHDLIKQDMPRLTKLARRLAVVNYFDKKSNEQTAV